MENIVNVVPFVRYHQCPMTTTSDGLLLKYGKLFEKATTHPLTEQLCQGTLEDRILFIYLAQDLQFFEEGLRLSCKIASLAPASHSLVKLAQKVGFFASAENTYFRDALELLQSSMDGEESRYYLENRLPQVGCYVNQLIAMTREPSYQYSQLITYLWCAEIVYWQWAHNLPRASHLHWKHQTWIDLHDGKHFEEWCNFLRDEVNQYSLEQVESTFEKFLRLEHDFFESCYKA